MNDSTRIDARAWAVLCRFADYEGFKDEEDFSFLVRITGYTEKQVVDIASLEYNIGVECLKAIPMTKEVIDKYHI